MPSDSVCVRQMKFDALATAANGLRHAPRRVGQQDQHGLRGGFFERLQQCVARQPHSSRRPDRCSQPASRRIGCSSPACRQFANLVDHNFAALHAILAQTKLSSIRSGCVPAANKQATAAVTAGIAIDLVLAKQVPLHETLQKIALAQPARHRRAASACGNASRWRRACSRDQCSACQGGVLMPQLFEQMR
jgi:hypothetical protein